jgi:hypothetical protein
MIRGAGRDGSPPYVFKVMCLKEAPTEPAYITGTERRLSELFTVRLHLDCSLKSDGK